MECKTEWEYTHIRPAIIQTEIKMKIIIHVTIT